MSELKVGDELAFYSPDEMEWNIYKVSEDGIVMCGPHLVKTNLPELRVMYNDYSQGPRNYVAERPTAAIREMIRRQDAIEDLHCFQWEYLSDDQRRRIIDICNEEVPEDV